MNMKHTRIFLNPGPHGRNRFPCRTESTAKSRPGLVIGGRAPVNGLRHVTPRAVRTAERSVLSSTVKIAAPVSRAASIRERTRGGEANGIASAIDLETSRGR